MRASVFPLFYGGNLCYYRTLLQTESVCFDLHEHFPKQTFRNRMEILGPNGLQKLIIPTQKTGERRKMGNVQISYAENWQKEHWKSLEAAYRRSPYFEFFEHEFRPLYDDKFEKLVNFNLRLHELVLSALRIELPHQFTDAYIGATQDWRIYDFTTQEIKPYTQVFSDRHPFYPNLSILDALFNLGPETIRLLS